MLIRHDLDLKFQMEFWLHKQKQQLQRNLTPNGCLQFDVAPIELNWKPLLQSLSIVSANYVPLQRVASQARNPLDDGICVTRILQSEIDRIGLSQLEITTDQDLTKLFPQANDQIDGPKMLTIHFETPPLEDEVCFETDGQGGLQERVLFGFRNIQSK